MLSSGVAAVALSLPMAAPATAAQPSTALAAGSGYATTIRYLSFHHVHPYGATVTISGQVVATVGDTTGAVSGVRVSLFRRVGGTSKWQYVAATTTSQTKAPEFHFRTTVKVSARYQVRFTGDAAYKPARAATQLAVHRLIIGRIEDRSGRLHGRVGPGYAHRWVHLEKRNCASCGWKHVRTARAGDHGRYRFTVGAPRTGHWYWRLTTSATKKFVRSSSGVFTTRRV